MNINYFGANNNQPKKKKKKKKCITFKNVYCVHRSEIKYSSKVIEKNCSSDYIEIIIRIPTRDKYLKFLFQIFV